MPDTLFQSTLPAWGATASIKANLIPEVVSIHAPRVRSDRAFLHRELSWIVFQSTLPAWGATSMLASEIHELESFNPRSPRGERRHKRIEICVPHVVSIHAPRVGSDVEILSEIRDANSFNPRSPRGERRG